MNNELLQELLTQLKEQQEMITQLKTMVYKLEKKNEPKPKKEKKGEGGGMQVVQPIRKLEDIQRFKQALQNAYHPKYYVLFILGINTNLRISDILALKVRDVRDRLHIETIEKKTKKPRLIIINDAVRSVVDPYIEDMNDDDYLFYSREGDNKPLTRQAVEHFLSKVADSLNFDFRFGCHSLRKTWGYHAWKAGTPLAVIQKGLNHTKLETTYTYLGITQDELDEAFSRTL